MNDELPKAVWEGQIELMGVPLKCFVLSDGRRIIDADSVAAFFDALGNTEWPAEQRHDGALEFAKFCRESGVPTYEMK